jgi:hypothetical protein
MRPASDPGLHRRQRPQGLRHAGNLVRATWTAPAPATPSPLQSDPWPDSIAALASDVSDHSWLLVVWGRDVVAGMRCASSQPGRGALSRRRRPQLRHLHLKVENILCLPRIWVLIIAVVRYYANE